MGSVVNGNRKPISAGTDRSIVTKLYHNLLRPALFSMDEERAHKLVLSILGNELPLMPLRGYFDVGKGRLSLTLNGKVKLDGPIGLAAGFDKDADALSGLSYVFDYLTFGTILPYRWPGNPETTTERPGSRRVARLPEERSLMNCQGFPSKGPEHVLYRLFFYTSGTPLSASLAVRPPDKSKGEDMGSVLKEFGDLVNSIHVSARRVIRMAEYNFASPNTDCLAVFLEPGPFKEVAAIAMREQDQKRAPLLNLLKLPPHHTDEEMARNMHAVEIWVASGGDGITITNTDKIRDARLSMGSGGKSGAPIYPTMLSNLDDYRKAFGQNIIINATGGIFAGNVPEVILDHGADTVQAFTPLIYDGIGHVRDSKIALLKEMDRRGIQTLEEVRKLRRDA